MPSLYQLKQVRSKFDHTSTYTMCRASSAVASSLELQPSSIWTLSDQDSNNAGMSQEKVGSLMFRTIAIQVINDGENAVLQHKDVKRITTLTKDSIITAILDKINLLFAEEQAITIIGNRALNNQLVDLAHRISNKRENDKKIDLIKNTMYC